MRFCKKKKKSNNKTLGVQGLETQDVLLWEKDQLQGGSTNSSLSRHPAVHYSPITQIVLYPLFYSFPFPFFFLA